MGAPLMRSFIAHEWVCFAPRTATHMRLRDSLCDRHSHTELLHPKVPS